jgi:hypothetical protein
MVTPPTAARLLEFAATWVGAGSVALTWRTGVEFDLIGFRLQRESPAGEWTMVRAGMIPAQGGGRPNLYLLIDANAREGTGKYRLFLVDTRGSASLAAEVVALRQWLVGLESGPVGLRLQIQGEPNVSAVIETSTNVRGPWAELQTIRLSPAGDGTLLLPVDRQESTRFYRLGPE